jgi:hypothetical protein
MNVNLIGSFAVGNCGTTRGTAGRKHNRCSDKQMTNVEEQRRTAGSEAKG